MPAPSPTPGITVDEIRAQRDRILDSKVFSRSKRQRDFLRYVVDATLEGRAESLKEFTLGIDVFERDASFDPGIDSIVRVEANRLRSKLRDYYGEEGHSDVVRIDIPKGHYVPGFAVADVAVAAPASRRRPYAWIGLVAAVLAIPLIYFTYGESNPASRPTVGPPPVPPDYSLAVLPLRDWSTMPEAYFSEAMTDALIAALGEVRSLRVTSLTSVMRYSDTELPVPEIARTLDVAYVVEGSVVRSEDLVRISAQLVAADTDTQIWSKTFDRPASNPLDVQSEVAAEIASQISAELRPSPRKPARQLNPAAYEAYMKGRYFYNQFTAEGFRRSMQHFHAAIDIEPNYAEAYAGLASCHCLLAGHGLELVSPVVAIPESQSLASKALALDPDLAEPIAFLGIIDFKYEWDLQSAEANLTRALEINPSMFQAHIWYSQILEATGRQEDAVTRARYAKQLNPLSLAASLNYGWQLYQVGNYNEAAAETDKLIQFNESFWGGHWVKGHIHNQHEMHSKALEAFRRAMELGGGHSLPMSALGYTLAIDGRHDEARQVIARMEALSENVYVSPFHIATVYAGLGEADRMFEWLERAYEVRARSLAWLHVTNEMAPYYEDPRFQELLARIGIHSI